MVWVPYILKGSCGTPYQRRYLCELRIFHEIFKLNILLKFFFYYKNTYLERCVPAGICMKPNIKDFRYILSQTDKIVIYQTNAGIGCFITILVFFRLAKLSKNPWLELGAILQWICFTIQIGKYGGVVRNISGKCYNILIYTSMNLLYSHKIVFFPHLPMILYILTA